MVWPVPRSLAATYGIEFSFSSSGYLDVSVPRVPNALLWIHNTSMEVCSIRFPHSEINGSKDICSSPSLIAAYHVFHRLLVPRHPPYALISLTFVLDHTLQHVLLLDISSPSVVTTLSVCLYFTLLTSSVKRISIIRCLAHKYVNIYELIEFSFNLFQCEVVKVHFLSD